MIQQQMLVYEEHSEAIAVLARAIDQLGKKDGCGAMATLMAYREVLIASQKPKVCTFDPRHQVLR